MDGVAIGGVDSVEEAGVPVQPALNKLNKRRVISGSKHCTFFFIEHLPLIIQ